MFAPFNTGIYLRRQIDTEWCNVELVLGTYADDGSIAMMFVDEVQQPVLTATVCLSGSGAPETPENHVWLKTWSENDGVDDWLEDANIVSLTGKVHPCGYAVAELAELGDTVKQILNDHLASLSEEEE